MKLDNLTKEQVDMCDIIWEVGTYEEFREVSRGWSPGKMNMALTLIQVMVQEELEQKIQAMDSYPLAVEMIESCR